MSDKKRRSICIAIAIFILLIGLAVTAYCYFWNHAQFDPAEDPMTEFEHGIVYEYYLPALIALPVCISLAAIIVVFMNNMKRLTKIMVFLAIIAIIIIGAAVSISSGSSGRSKKSYAEQYGYSPEDFYYKGSDGLWYKK